MDTYLTTSHMNGYEGVGESCFMQKDNCVMEKDMLYPWKLNIKVCPVPCPRFKLIHPVSRRQHHLCMEMTVMLAPPLSLKVSADKRLVAAYVTAVCVFT